jgi:predicted transcriptional regulator YdeE
MSDSPEMVDLPALTLIGLEFVGSHAEVDFPGLWHVFINRVAELGIDVHQPHTLYGASGPAPDGRPGHFAYLAGAAGDPANVPEGMTVWQVPAGTYACRPSTIEQVHEVFGGLAAWAQASADWQPTGRYLEVYDRDFPHTKVMQVHLRLDRRAA